MEGKGYLNPDQTFQAEFNELLFISIALKLNQNFVDSLIIWSRGSNASSPLILRKFHEGWAGKQLNFRGGETQLFTRQRWSFSRFNVGHVPLQPPNQQSNFHPSQSSFSLQTRHPINLWSPSCGTIVTIPFCIVLIMVDFIHIRQLNRLEILSGKISTSQRFFTHHLLRTNSQNPSPISPVRVLPCRLHQVRTSTDFPMKSCAWSVYC
jgi:hypothetical protein